MSMKLPSSNMDARPIRGTRSMKDIVNQFADETTGHGIPRVINRPKFLSKLFWATLVLSLFGIFIMQTYRLLKDYYSFNTKIELVNSEAVIFPAITVCNLNRIKLSALPNDERWGSVKLQGEEDNRRVFQQRFPSTHTPWRDPRPTLAPDPRYEGPLPLPPRIINRSTTYPETTAATLTTSPTFFGSTQPVPTTTGDSSGAFHERVKRDTAVDDDYPWFFDSVHEEKELQENRPVVNFHPGLGSSFHQVQLLDIPIPTKQELKEFGHKKEDFILECRFNQRRCFQSNFTVMQKKQYGNCFTFNGDSSNDTAPKRVTKAGNDFGLHLTLFIEHEDYIGAMTADTGVRIVAHPRDISPHPEDLGLSLSPGFTTNIGLRQVEIRRLPHPHGDCSVGTNYAYLSADKYSYNIISCQKRCLQDNLNATCGCVSDIYDDYDALPQCNRTSRICRQGVEKLFFQNRLGCNCPAKCRKPIVSDADPRSFGEFTYNAHTTSSIWPSQKHFDYWKARARGKSIEGFFSDHILSDVNAARENLVRVKIYFEELNYELVEQVEAYTFESVVGTTGGLLGLYVGFSLITVSEIFVLVYDVISLLIERTFCRKVQERSNA